MFCIVMKPSWESWRSAPLSPQADLHCAGKTAPALRESRQPALNSQFHHLSSSPAASFFETKHAGGRLLLQCPGCFCNQARRRLRVTVGNGWQRLVTVCPNPPEPLEYLGTGGVLGLSFKKCVRSDYSLPVVRGHVELAPDDSRAVLLWCPVLHFRAA